MGPNSRRLSFFIATGARAIHAFYYLMADEMGDNFGVGFRSKFRVLQTV
jgi:hypothetical protein